MAAEYQHTLPVGIDVEQYEIKNVLGAGGFGITYKGWDNRLHRDVALKEFLPVELAVRGKDDISVQPRDAKTRKEYTFGLKKFLEEARMLARFKEPNIVRVTNFLEANGTAYLVMDYEEGESLAQYLGRHHILSEDQLNAIFIATLHGLRAVHDKSVLHRDIKPGNIYLRKDGTPMLIDFGAARQALGEQTHSMTGIVTVGYAPFEQYSARGKQGPWTDKDHILSEDHINAIFIATLHGLRAVHDKSVLHRDIKPGNIYLRKDGTPMLIDFGAARQALGEQTHSMTGIVTVGYAPFEQYSARGKQGLVWQQWGRWTKEPVRAGQLIQ